MSHRGPPIVPARSNQTTIKQSYHVIAQTISGQSDGSEWVVSERKERSVSPPKIVVETTNISVYGEERIINGYGKVDSYSVDTHKFALGVGLSEDEEIAFVEAIEKKRSERGGVLTKLDSIVVEAQAIQAHHLKTLQAKDNADSNTTDRQYKGTKMKQGSPKTKKSAEGQSFIQFLGSLQFGISELPPIIPILLVGVVLFVLS